MKVQFARINGLQTRYFVAGDGPLLLLVHPVGYPAEIYARNIEPLSREHTVVALDLPGQGFSEAPAQWRPAPQVAMARHVSALALHLGFPCCSILGSSLGGIVAALVALHDTVRVERLVLVGTGSVFNEPSGQPAILERVYANGSRVYASPSLQTLRSRLANTCFVAPPADDILLAHLSAYALPGAGENYRLIVQGLSETIGDPACSVYPFLERLTMSALIVIGDEDTRTSYEAHRAGGLRMRDARLLRFARCGHLPFLECADEFNDAVESFLNGGTVGECIR
jgi:2-hydroxy-6-oxonona-2,4-dienedioate hydrolase